MQARGRGPGGRLGGRIDGGGVAGDGEKGRGDERPATGMESDGEVHGVMLAHPTGAGNSVNRAPAPARYDRDSAIRLRNTVLTLLVLLLAAAFAAYALVTRRRHLRLRAACHAAFDDVYATVTPLPGFEMAYSYGEPVFQVAFASKADLQAAADANAAFLRAIDALCKDRGRKRQFKAQRSVFFQHPDKDEPVIATHCCDAMRAQVGKAVAYEPRQRAYGLKTSKIGTPALPIAHCPWCGSVLPPESAAD
jgi:hypothetical protein